MTHMDRLRQMLDEKGIEYESEYEEADEFLKDVYGGVPMRDQVFISLIGGACLSAIGHFGAYGFREGLIECYDFVNEPEGYLTAEEAFAWIVERLPQMQVAIAQAVEFDDGHIGIKVRNRRALIVSRDEARRIWHDLARILGESEDDDDRR